MFCLPSSWLLLIKEVLSFLFPLSTKDARGHWAKRSKKVGAGGGGGGRGGEGKETPAAEHRHFTERRSSANGNE